MKINSEVIDALATLRVGARGAYNVSPAVRDAINTLDNADVFAEIDDVAWQGDVIEPDSAPLDPAEWGDTTRADMARHQGFDAADRRAEGQLGRRAFGLD